MLPETEKDSSEFSEFDSISGVIAYVHHLAGAQAVQQVIAGSNLNVAELIAVATELTAVGLPKVAAIIDEAVESAPEAEPPWPGPQWWKTSSPPSRA